MNRKGINTVANLKLGAYNFITLLLWSKANECSIWNDRGCEDVIRAGGKTFYDTFAKDNTPEDMDTYLKKSFSEEIQFRELSKPDVVFLIAESKGIPVGYAQLILNSKDEAINGTRALEIRRIYASQEYLGKGVGKTLMLATIREARQRGCDCVWEKNQRAIDFYKKWGFREVGTHIFSVGSDSQNDFVMELGLLSSSDEFGR